MPKIFVVGRTLHRFASAIAEVVEVLAIGQAQHEIGIGAPDCAAPVALDGGVVGEHRAVAVESRAP